MNKPQAMRMAKRFVVGLIHQQLYGKGPIPRDPLVYDFVFKDELVGRRLSKEDRWRVEEALEEIEESLFNQGQRGEDVDSCQADGKPGHRWGGYRDQRKRQGYEKP